MVKFAGDVFKAVLTLFFIITAVFFIISAMPGDPARLIAGDFAPPEEVEKLRKELNLDKPLLQRYVHTIISIATLNFGNSLYTNQKVKDILKERLKNTFILTFSSISLSMIFGIFIFLLYFKFRRAEDIITTITTVLWSIPNFWLGLVLIIVFSVKLKIFPVSGFDSPKGLFLPALTLSVSLSVVTGRFMKNLSDEFLSSDFYLFLKAKGVRGWRRIFHIIRFIMPGIMTVIGIQAGVLLSGAVVTETLFSFPGIGLLTVESVVSRDFPLIYACVFTISSLWVVINFAVDKIIRILDPRMR